MDATAPKCSIPLLRVKNGARGGEPEQNKVLLSAGDAKEERRVP